jgi:hypothetical protein
MSNDKDDITGQALLHLEGVPESVIKALATSASVAFWDSVSGHDVEIMVGQYPERSHGPIGKFPNELEATEKLHVVIKFEDGSCVGVVVGSNGEVERWFCEWSATTAKNRTHAIMKALIKPMAQKQAGGRKRGVSLAKTKEYLRIAGAYHHAALVLGMSQKEFCEKHNITLYKLHASVGHMSKGKRKV